METSLSKSTRDHILDATDRLMARYGFRKTTVEDVAREAAVARRTIYLYFRSKKDLGLASIARVVDRVLCRLEKIAARRDPAADRLREMLYQRIMTRVLLVQDIHHNLDELFEAVRPAYMSRRKEFFQKELALISRVVWEGKQSGEFHVADVDATAEALLHATNAFLPYSLSARDLGKPQEVEAKLNTMLDTLMLGMCRR
jgi:AcrR family transcriptional regulator